MFIDSQKEIFRQAIALVFDRTESTTNASRLYYNNTWEMGIGEMHLQTFRKDWGRRIS